MVLAMRVQTIGWELAGAVSADLHAADSLAEAHIVLLDPSAVVDLWQDHARLEADGIWRIYPDSDLGLSRAIERLLGRRRAELAALLRNGGIAAVSVRAVEQEVEITPAGGGGRRLDPYGFLPALSFAEGPHHLALPRGVRMVPRRGRILLDLMLDHPLAGYLRASASHGYEAVVVSSLGAPLEAFGSVLARDKVGDVVAWDLPVGQGHLVFLPWSPAAAGADLSERLIRGLAALADVPLGHRVPEWMTRYRLPGEDALEAKAGEIAEKRLRIDREEEELTATRRESDVLKGLLYPRGRGGLATATCAALERLGFACRADACDPVLIEARSPEGELLVRVSFAHSGAIGPEEHRALLLALDRARAEERREVSGMLVVVAEPRLDPRHRPPQWEDAVRRGCAEHGIALVSGYQLFKAVEATHDGAQLKPIRESLLAAEGEWKWKG